jgi:hypothetical protein
MTIKQDWVVKKDGSQSETLSLEEAAICNMWEIAAIVEVLERKGLWKKQDLYGKVPVLLQSGGLILCEGI